MKIFTSYFYNIRFFKPNYIPISTAVWDPKWFHDFRGQDFKFLDKNGVINGLRAERLHPGRSCCNLCRGKPCQFSHSTCGFLREYRKQIFSIDREKYLKELESLCTRLKKVFSISEELEVMFIVHEAPDNECSEREVLKDFFCCDEWRK